MNRRLLLIISLLVYTTNTFCSQTPPLTQDPDTPYTLFRPIDPKAERSECLSPELELCSSPIPLTPPKASSTDHNKISDKTLKLMNDTLEFYELEPDIYPITLKNKRYPCSFGWHAGEKNIWINEKMPFFEQIKELVCFTIAADIHSGLNNLDLSFKDQARYLCKKLLARNDMALIFKLLQGMTIIEELYKQELLGFTEALGSAGIIFKTEITKDSPELFLIRVTIESTDNEYPEFSDQILRIKLNHES